MRTVTRWALCATAAVLMLGWSAARADSVAAGYDLLQTTSGTSFMMVPLEGVPIGNYNFGGTIGVQDIGDADTIVQRLAATTPDVTSYPTTESVSTVMDALQLQTVAPTDLGAGVGYYYVTLQSAHGGPASTGSLSITFDTANPGGGGTFTSSLDVFYDVRYGSLSGPIILSSDATLTTSGPVAWGRTAPGGALAITGVDYQLDGTDNAQDFWPTTSFTENEPGVVHAVQDAMLPEPGSATLLVVGAGGMLLKRRRRA